MIANLEGIKKFKEMANSNFRLFFLCKEKKIRTSLDGWILFLSFRCGLFISIHQNVLVSLKEKTIWLFRMLRELPLLHFFLCYFC